MRDCKVKVEFFWLIKVTTLDLYAFYDKIYLKAVLILILNQMSGIESLPEDNFKTTLSNTKEPSVTMLYTEEDESPEMQAKIKALSEDEELKGLKFFRVKLAKTIEDSGGPHMLLFNGTAKHYSLNKTQEGLKKNMKEFLENNV